MAILLGTASASVNLDIAGLMGPADQAIGKLNELGSVTGSPASAGFFTNLTRGALAFGTALIGPVTLGTAGMIQLEDAVNGVGVSFGNVDPSVLGELEDLFIDVGSASQFSAVEVANVTDAYAKAGFSVDQVMGGLTESTVELAQATGDGLLPATNGMISAMNIWNPAIVDTSIALTDASRAADIFTIASNESAGGINDIVAGLTNVGPSAAAVGLSFEDTAAAIAYFTNFGYSGGEAGTKLARSLQFLANPTEEAATLLNELGIAAFDAEGNFVGLPDLFDQLNRATADMTDQERIAAFKTIFGAEGYDAMLIGAAGGGDALRDLRGEMDQTGVTAEQSALRMNTILAKLGELKESTLALFGSFMSGLQPVFHAVLDFANGVINALQNIPDSIKTIVGAVAGLLAGFAIVTRAVQGFQLLNGIFGALSGSSAVTAASTGRLALILTRIVPLVGLAATAFLAWKNNWLGVRGVVDQVGGAFDGVKSFINRFLSAFRKVEAPTRGLATAFEKLKTPVDAFRSGFQSILGIAEDVAEPFATVLGFGERLGGALDRLAGPADGIAQGFGKIGDAAETASGAVSTLGRIFDALAFAIRGINGGEIPDWLEDIAQGFDEAQRLADRFFGLLEAGRMAAILNGANPLDAFISGIRAGLSAIDIGAIAIRVGDWIVSSVADVATAIWDWVTGTALPAAGNAAITIASVALSIADWVISAAKNVGSAIATWVTDTALPTAAGVALSIASVAISIADWIVSSVKNVGSAIATWVTETALPTAQSLAFDLASVAVSILDWAVSAAKSLWTGITDFITNNAVPGIQGLAADVGSVALRIVDWFVADAPGMWTTITDFVRLAWSTISGGVIDLVEAVKTAIDNFEVAVDESAFWAAVEAAVVDLWRVDEASVEVFRSKANEFGRYVGSNLLGWIIEGVSGGSSGGAGDGSGLTGGGGGQNLVTALGAGFDGFVSGFVDGIKQAFEDKMRQEWEDFKIDLSSLVPEFSWPEAPAVEDIPFVTDVLGLFEDIESDISDAWDEVTTIELGSLDFDWPDVSSVLDSVPQWMKDFVSMNPVDFVKKYLGGSGDGDTVGPKGGGEGFELQALRAPGLQGRISLPDLSGLADAKAQLDAFRESSRGVTDDLKAILATPLDASGITSGLQAAKDAIVSTMATIGTTITTGLSAAMQTAVVQVQGMQIGQAFVTGIQQGISAGSAGVRAAITAVMTSVSQAVTTGMTQARTVTVAGTQAMAAAMVSGMSIFRNAVTSGMAGAVSAVRSGVAQMVAAANTGRGMMLSAGLAIGAALGQGIASGIRSQLGNVVAAATSVVTTAVAAARAAGGIQSPSTVMRDQVGVNLALGTAEGILKGLPAIYSAANRMVYVPDVPNRSFATGGGGMTTIVYDNSVSAPVTVEGSVTTENQILARWTQLVTEAKQQRDTAIGVR